MREHIYIGGDSFCAFRNQSHLHWPVRLADNLKLTLNGAGFAGQSWWNTRKNLLEYSTTTNFRMTKLFIICHTDFNRPLTDTKIDTHNHPEIHETYYRHIFSEDISKWVYGKWISELNEILAGKNVIHLLAFDNNLLFHRNKNNVKLNGTVFGTTLVSLSLAELGIKDIREGMSDDRENHFTPEGNLKLADYLTNFIQQQNPPGNYLLDFKI